MNEAVMESMWFWISNQTSRLLSAPRYVGMHYVSFICTTIDTGVRMENSGVNNLGAHRSLRISISSLDLFLHFIQCAEHSGTRIIVEP